MISVTLDSNIYIAALQFGSARLLDLGRRGLIRIDTSDVILAETIGVLRDKFGWDGYRLHFARLELLKFVNRVEPTEIITAADDPDDNRILECAVTAGSDFIVTRDKDLLRLDQFQEIRIVAPEQFFQPDFIIVETPDPVEALLKHFPELEYLREDADMGGYYVYNRFADYLKELEVDQELWRRAYEFFEKLAHSHPDLLQEVFESLVDGKDGRRTIRLRESLGPAALELLRVP